MRTGTCTLVSFDGELKTWVKKDFHLMSASQRCNLMIWASVTRLVLSPQNNAPEKNAELRAFAHQLSPIEKEAVLQLTSEMEKNE